MQISCALAPGRPTPEHAVLAEELGYERVWLYDSSALYGDVWIGLARIAERTSRIGMGTGVAVPSLRHPMVTAAAIADIEQLAPGRLACAFGTGFSARLAIGKRAMMWARFGEYLRQLRALLAGEVVDVDGAAVQMIHGTGFAPPDRCARRSSSPPWAPRARPWPTSSATVRSSRGRRSRGSPGRASTPTARSAIPARTSRRRGCARRWDPST